MSTRTPGRILLAWLPALAYMLLIWTMSSFPMAPVPIEDVPFQDKGIHFAEYGVLAFLLGHALSGTWPGLSAGRRFWFAALGTLLWGMLDEIHQAYVPGRHSDVRDVVADALGAALGALAYLMFERLRAHLAVSAGDDAAGDGSQAGSAEDRTT